MTTPLNAQSIGQHPLTFNSEARQSFELLTTARASNPVQEKNWNSTSIQGTLENFNEADITKLQATILWQELRLFKKSGELDEQWKRMDELVQLFNLQEKLPKKDLEKRIRDLKAQIAENANVSRFHAVKLRLKEAQLKRLEAEQKNILGKRFKAIKLALSKQGVVIPPYNERLQPIHEKIKEALHIYRYAVNNKNCDNAKKQARLLLLGLNTLLHNPDAIETENLISGLTQELGKIPENNPLSPIRNFLSNHKKLASDFYTKRFGNVQVAFLEAMDLQANSAHADELAKVRDLADLKKKGYKADPETKHLIKSMLDKMGSDKINVIRKYYNDIIINQHFLKQTKRDRSKYKDILSNFLGQLRQDFFDTQRTDSALFGLTESRKATTLKHWKHAINRFARKHALEGGIAHRRQFDIGFDTCADLLMQLNVYLTESSGFEHLKKQDLVYNETGTVKEPIIVIQQKQYQQDLYEASLSKLRITLLEDFLGKTISDEKRAALEKQINNILDFGFIEEEKKASLRKLLIKLQNRQLQFDLEELGAELFGLYTAYSEQEKEQSKLSHRNALLNAIKLQKKDCLNRLKKLRYGLNETLEDNLLPYTARVNLYHWTNNHTTHREKENQRWWKTWAATPAAETSAGVLTFGQAAISFYAGIFFFPLIGPSAFGLAGALFLFTLITNIILFRGATRQVINQLIVKRDFWVGFNSNGGRILMLLAWVTAMSLALMQAVMTFVAIQAVVGALAMVFPPLAAFSAPLSVFIAIPTFMGFTALMYVSIAALMTGACNFLEKRFPEIAEKGWGLDGLVLGLMAGIKRVFYTYPKQLGGRSWLAGVGLLVKAKLSQMARYYWTNPTGDLNDVQIMKGKKDSPLGKTQKDYLKAVWTARLTHISGTIIKGLLYALGASVVIFGTAALLNIWQTEIAALLSTVGVANAIATNLSKLIVFTLPATAWYIFSAGNTAYCFNWLSAKVTNGCNRFIYNPLAIFRYNGPVAFATHVWEGTKGLGSTIKYGITHPLETLKSFAGVLLGFSVGVNALANGALVAKGEIMPPMAVGDMLNPEFEVKTTDFSSMTTMENTVLVNDIASISATSFTANMMASLKWWESGPAHVHLYDLRGAHWDENPYAATVQQDIFAKRKATRTDEALMAGEYASVFSQPAREPVSAANDEQRDISDDYSPTQQHGFSKTSS